MIDILAFFKVVFWGCLLLSVLVFLHEGGHYLLARLSGMRVTEFFLGMPCSLNLSFTSKSRGTRFGITPVLLGGYTRIAGMEGEPSEHCADVLANVCINGYTTVERCAETLDLPEDVVESDLDVLLDWGSIVRTHNALKRKSDGSLESIGKIDTNFDPELYERVDVYLTIARDPELRCIYDKGHDLTLENSTTYGDPHPLIPLSKAIALSKEGTLVNARDAAQDFFAVERTKTYLGKGFLARFLTLVAGPLVNVILGLMTIALVLSIAGTEVVVNTSTISGITEGSLADDAGLVAGDTITSVAGEGVASWSEFSSAISDAANLTEPFDITYVHEGSTDEITSKVDPSALKEAGYFGVFATTTMYHPPLSVSLGVAWDNVVSVAKYVVKLFMPQHTVEIVSQSSSVVGISVMASEAAESGGPDYLYLLAMVSLSLGFMNLVPIPPLDGGKILLEIIGAVRRKPISLKVQLGLSYVGLVLFLGLFVFALKQDVFRFILGG